MMTAMGKQKECMKVNLAFMRVEQNVFVIFNRENVLLEKILEGGNVCVIMVEMGETAQAEEIASAKAQGRDISGKEVVWLSGSEIRVGEVALCSDHGELH